MENKSTHVEEQAAIRVSVNTIIVNLVLSLFKLSAGLLAHSGAMVSDGIHSASDVISTVIVMAGVRLSGKASDKNHQYGHERLECVAAILLSVLLALTGVGIGVNGVRNILNSLQGEFVIAIPGALALAAAVLSVAVKEAMYWYTRRTAIRIKSSAMMADAWHHRSDALSSVGSFVGILGARMGYPVLDPMAGIVICAFIVKAAADIFFDAVRKMTDEACDESTTERMREVILRQDGVRGIDELKTRVFGSRIYVDVEICADGEKTLRETHRIAEKVHQAIEGQFGDVKHCMVHVNPEKVQRTEAERRERLTRQMDFILELDKSKQIKRQTYVTASPLRQENDAEHSWHLALMCVLLAEYANAPIDVLKTVTMLLIHDVVEIDAGDTYAYDEAGQKDKRAREERAAERIFGMLPEEQAAYYRGLWEEFEARNTAEARFANSMDKIQPILLNHATGGISWREHEVAEYQIRERNRDTWQGTSEVWRYAEELIRKNVEKGNIRRQE